jgi:hypothetical protein
MYYRKCLMAILIMFSFTVTAQETDITGLWKGTLYNDTTQMNYQYEIGIGKEKGRYVGFSHTWFILDDKQYYGVKKVTIRIANDGKIIVEDDRLISNNYPVPPNKNVRQLNVLTLDATAPIMTLTGLFSTNRTKEYNNLTGSVSLQRKNDFWQSALIPHLEELGKANDLSFVRMQKEAANKLASDVNATAANHNINKQAEETNNVEATLKKESAAKVAAEKEALDVAAEVAKVELDAQEAAEKAQATEQAAAEKANKTTENSKTAIASTQKENNNKELRVLVSKPAASVNERQTIVQQTVSFTSDSLLLTLYDNGEVDGDTVSVLLNGQLILEKQGLSTVAIKKTIYIPANTDRMELVMYAESLGSITPNTGLLVIRDGKQLYEVRFSGDLQKNASIVFNRKKE